ncbi:MAG: hypothetical protein ACLFS0_07955, partial [Bacteroidales bacterium]
MPDLVIPTLEGQTARAMNTTYPAGEFASYYFIHEFDGPRSQNFIVPPGVAEIFVEAWGAGGAGGGCVAATDVWARGAGGGGGGAYAASTIDVEPGTVLIVEAAGESGCETAANGMDGGASFVSPADSPGLNLVYAAGGKGGERGFAGSTQHGGAGGGIDDSVGNVVRAGENGANGTTGAFIRSGRGGSAPAGVVRNGGSGGGSLSGGGLTSDGNPGSFPGGGGGGARTSKLTDGEGSGGDGGAGLVVISYDAIDAGASALDRHPANVRADGRESAELIIYVEDSGGNPVQGIPQEDFLFSGTGDANIRNFSEDGAGVYRFEVVNQTVETLSIDLSVRGVPLGQFPVIEFDPGATAAIIVDDVVIDDRYFEVCGNEVSLIGGCTCEGNFNGIWTYEHEDGTGEASFLPDGSPTSTEPCNPKREEPLVRVTEYGLYTFTWTLTSGDHKGTSATVSVFFSHEDDVYADAGEDKAVCGTVATMTANDLSGDENQEGSWSLQFYPDNATVEFLAPDDPHTDVVVSDPGEYVFVWTVTDGACLESSDVSVTYDFLPEAYAGADAVICETGVLDLAG